MEARARWPILVGEVKIPMVGKTAQENPLNFGFENVLIQFDSESSRKAG